MQSINKLAGYAGHAGTLVCVRRDSVPADGTSFGTTHYPKHRVRPRQGGFSPRRYQEEYVGCDSIESDLSGCDNLESDDSSVCWTDLHSWDRNREYPMDDFRNVPPQAVNGTSPISYLCLEDQSNSEDRASVAPLSLPKVDDINKTSSQLESSTNALRISDGPAPQRMFSPETRTSSHPGADNCSGNSIPCPLGIDGVSAPTMDLESYRVEAIESETELQQFKTNLLLALSAQQAEERKCEDDTAKYRDQMMRISTYLQQECESITESLATYENNNDNRLKSALDLVLNSEYHQTEEMFCKRMNKIALENPNLHIRESKNIADAWDNAAGLLEVVLEDQFLLDTLDMRVHHGLSEIEDMISELEQEKAELTKQSSWLLEPASA